MCGFEKERETDRQIERMREGERNIAKGGDGSKGTCQVLALNELIYTL